MRQYVGARYVPRFLDTYDPTQDYEALDVVDNGMGTSYISKIPTPAGTPLTDTTHWAIYGASNGAIINLQNQIGDIANLTTIDRDNLVDAINEVKSGILFVNVKDFGAVGDGLTDDTSAIQDALDTKMDVFFPLGTYNISSTLNYDGNKLFGKGTIFTASPLEKAIACETADTDKQLEVDGLTIDGDNKSAALLWIHKYEYVHVHNCKAKNTQNDALLNVRGCVGVGIYDCGQAEVNDCIITNINRTQTSPGIISSAGIVSAADNSFIHDNVVEHVACTAEHSDCDGIYTTGRAAGNAGLFKGISIIQNNRMTDPTGRFVKSQNKLTTVKNNELIINTDWVPDAMFIAIDTQMGNAVIDNNYIDLKNSYNRNYTFIARSDLDSANGNINITITNNTIKGIYSASAQCRAILRIDNSTSGYTIEAKISNNTEIGMTFEDVVTMLGSVIPVGSVHVLGNRLLSGKVVSSNTINNLYGLMFVVEDNDNSDNSAELEFSSYLTPFDSLIWKNNANAAVLYTTGLDFTTLKICDFVHYDATKIANKDYGGTGYIHMVKDAHAWHYTYLEANIPQPTYWGKI